MVNLEFSLGGAYHQLSQYNTVVLMMMKDMKGLSLIFVQLTNFWGSISVEQVQFICGKYLV
jgi:hypothetical protein